MDLHQLALVLQILGLAAGAWVSVKAFGKWIWPAFKRFWSVIACAWDRLRVVWHLLEKGLPALTTEIAEMRTTINTMSGKILDVPQRLDGLTKQGQERKEQVKMIGDQVGQVVRQVAIIGSTVRAQNNANPSVATFKLDHSGKCFEVNRTFCKWVGLSPPDLTDWRWLATVHPDDRDRVRGELVDCIHDAIRWQSKFRMVALSGTSFDVDGSADPIPDGAIPAELWQGQIYRSIANIAA
jgi:PAS domain S-box-containing protein